jgi:hypothetical protein
MRPSLRKPVDKVVPPREPVTPPVRPTSGRLVLNDPAYLSFLLARISGGRRRKGALRKPAE